MVKVRKKCCKATPLCIFWIEKGNLIAFDNIDIPVHTPQDEIFFCPQLTVLI